MDLSVEPYASDNDTETTFEAKPVEKKNRLSAEPVVVDVPNSSFEIRYGECLRNHAASLGGHASDGCGEFMPSIGSDSLTCAACGCHRNFHKREEMSLHPALPPPRPLFLYPHPNHRTYHHQPLIVAQPLKLNSPRSPPLQLLLNNSNAGPNPLNHVRWATRLHSNSDHDRDGGNGYDDAGPDYDRTPEREDHVQVRSTAATVGSSMAMMMRGKRFRTKFTGEQKNRMREYAEKLGWRMQRQDDVALNQFCAEIGVTRHVFKVWMHNNKTNGSGASNVLRGNDPPPPPSSNVAAPPSPLTPPPSTAPAQPTGV